MKKFSFTIENLGDELTGYHGSGQFLAVDSLSTEGNNFEELCNSCEIYTQDQDGGSGPYLMLGDLPQSLITCYESLIKDKMMLQLEKD